MLSWVLLALLVATVLGEDLLLGGQAIQRTVPARESLLFQINTSLPYAYVSVEGCHMPKIDMSQNGKQTPPEDTLLPAGFLYPINHTAQLLVNSSQIEKPTTVKVIGLEGERDLPKNRWKIHTEISEDYLKISFRAIKLFEKHVHATYGVWFSRTPAEIDCWIFNNVVPTGAAGTVMTQSISTDDKDTIDIWIPTNNDQPELSNNTYSKKEEIMAMINQFENFYVTVLANMSAPYPMVFMYQHEEVEHSLNIVDL